jgi:predicted DCC family thiol-disulfide oxidoreductase YuxK
MKTLTIFYDPRCGLCTGFRRWLESQPKRVRVEFLGYDSGEALARFPALRTMGGDREVVVLSDDGRWWQGDAAWITCLWATLSYRDWAFRLSSRTMRPFLRKAVHLISENRLTLSRLMHLRTEEALASAIKSLPDPACAGGTCAVPQTHTPVSS